MHWSNLARPAGIEPAHPAPEAGALSPELRAQSEVFALPDVIIAQAWENCHAVQNIFLRQTLQNRQIAFSHRIDY